MRLLTKLAKVKTLLLCLCLATVVFSSPAADSLPWLGMRFMTAFHNPRYLLGRGAPGCARQKYLHNRPVNVWEHLQRKGSDATMHRLTRMTLEQFEMLLADLSALDFPHVAQLMGFANRVLCVFIWLVKYPDYSELAILFGVGVSTISSLVNRLGAILSSSCFSYVDVLVPYFAQYISNQTLSKITSSLSNRIVAIIDATIHAIQKPASRQHLF